MTKEYIASLYSKIIDLEKRLGKYEQNSFDVWCNTDSLKVMQNKLFGEFITLTCYESPEFYRRVRVIVKED